METLTIFPNLFYFYLKLDLAIMKIFTTLLLKKMNILSPFTTNTNVKINNSDFHTFLFQEKINSNF